MKNILLLLSLLVAFTSCKGPSKQEMGFLKVDGTRIVNASTGDEIILRGMGLGGWMLQEGYMLQIRERGMQHAIKERITNLIGEEETDRFYQLWLQNHTTRADIDSMARWGFNSVRLAMHYNLFTLPIEEEPVVGEHTWLEQGFLMVDNLTEWCKANNIYLILDLHAAPGGQGKDANISDYDASKPSLWESELNKQKTIALWRKLAERYVNEPTIGGFDIINEPNWTFEGLEPHGREDTLNQPLWDLLIKITQAIREVNTNHIIFTAGNGWGNNYRGFPGPWDNNLVLSFHKYWNPNDQQSIEHFIAMRDKYNMPLWLGETGENSNKWFTDCIMLMEKNGIGWAMWPLKKIRNVRGPLSVPAPDEYDQLIDYWHGQGERPSEELASRVLFQIAENLKIENNIVIPDVIDAMFRQAQGDGSPKPFKWHSLPSRIFAVDYDLGYFGLAYFDEDSERTGLPGQTSGNKGRGYRNDGVDIDKCTDEPELTNGYAVVGIADGEWLHYTINSDVQGVFQIEARVAYENDTNGAISLKVNGEETILNVPVTLNPEQKWQTINLGSAPFVKGSNTLKLKFEEGGFMLNYFEIVSI